MLDKMPSSSSDMFSDDPAFLEALASAVFPGDLPAVQPKDEPVDSQSPSSVTPTSRKRPRSPSPPRSPTVPSSYTHQIPDPGQRPTSIIHKLGEEEGSYLDNDDTYGASKFNDWGNYMRRKRAKLQVQNSEIEEKSEEGGMQPKPKIFKGLSIYINGFTVPSNQVLRTMITQHGGVYQPYLDKKTLVTHVIATNLTPSKVIEFARMKIVKPEWIVNSVEGGKLLPWRDFILHTADTERVDEAQGMKTAQKSLFDGFATQAQRGTQQNALTARPSLRKEPSREADSVTEHLNEQKIAASPKVNVGPPATSPAAATDDASGSAQLGATLQLSIHKETSNEADSVIPTDVPNPAGSSRNTTPHTVAAAPLVEKASVEATTPKKLALGTPQKLSPSTTVFYSTDPVTLEAAAHIPSYAAHTSNVSAARLMADPAWAAAHTSASGADFIEGFYQKSRLHHLSTWKAELKELVAKAQLRAESGDGKADGDGKEGGVSMAGHSLALPDGKARMDPKGKRRAEDRVIMHCDFDSFFVAAGLVERTELKGKPVVVCHSQGKGGEGVGRLGSSTSEVASASYEARKFGIKNGMSLGQARKLCPAVETIPYEFEKYKEFSLQFYTILMAYADDVQAVSVDEALIEVTSSVARARLAPRTVTGDGAEDVADPAKELAEKLRDEVRRVTGCEISVGISHNILLARLATRKAKPAGSHHLLPSDVPSLLEDLDVGDLHGVGWSIREKVETNLSVTKVGELAKQPKAALQKLLGPKMGEKLWNAARGIDHTQLESHKQRKSVSAEVNYGIRFETEEQSENFVRDLSREVSKRLTAISMKGRLLTLKLMKRHPEAPKEAAKFMGHGICETFNKSTPMNGRGGTATDDPNIIGDEAWKLMKSFGFDPKELRGIGIQIQKLEGGVGSSGPQEAHGAGQGVLEFQKVPSPSKRSAKEATEDDSPRGERSPKKSRVVYDVYDVIGTQLALPSPSQIDPTVLDSLPEEIRATITAQMNRNPPLVVPAQPRVQPTETIESGPSEMAGPRAVALDVEVLPPDNVSALPSFTQLDQSVLDALPEDIREELEQEYTRMRSVAASERPQAGPSEARSPSKAIKPKGPDVKHIARQLAPKRNTDRSPAKYSIFKRREAPALLPLEISDEDLLELKIDPDVFRALPGDLQREQLDEQRRALKLPPRPLERKPKVVPVRASRSPSAAPRGRPVYTANHPPEPNLNKVSETSGVRDLVERWFLSGVESGPHEKDLKRIGDFLVRSVDSAQATDAGLEKVVTVMKWWGHLCKLHLGDEDGEMSGVGKAWWAAFSAVKSRLDTVVKKRFGGKLSLS